MMWRQKIAVGVRWTNAGLSRRFLLCYDRMTCVQMPVLAPLAHSILVNNLPL